MCFQTQTSVGRRFQHTLLHLRWKTLSQRVASYAHSPVVALCVCAGICDATVASCFCDGKFKRIFAPKGSNYRVQPIQPGRTLGDHCMLKTVSFLPTTLPHSQGSEITLLTLTMTEDVIHLQPKIPEKERLERLLPFYCSRCRLTTGGLA